MEKRWSTVYKELNKFYNKFPIIKQYFLCYLYYCNQSFYDSKF